MCFPKESRMTDDHYFFSSVKLVVTCACLVLFHVYHVVDKYSIKKIMTSWTIYIYIEYLFWNKEVMTCWSYNIDLFTGWWFGCHFLFSHKILGCCHHPNWRTPSFFRGVALAHQPVDLFRSWYFHENDMSPRNPPDSRDSSRPWRPEVAPSQRRWYLGSDRARGCHVISVTIVRTCLVFFFFNDITCYNIIATWYVSLSLKYCDNIFREY